MLVELARAARASTCDAPRDARARCSRELAEAVPLYAGMTLDEIGGRGRALAGARGVGATPRARRSATSRFGPPADAAARRSTPATASLRLATAPGLWASWVTERSPVAAIPAADQELELNPLDAERLGVAPGDEVAGAQRTATPSTATVRSATRAKPGHRHADRGHGGGERNVLVDGAPVVVEIDANARTRVMLPLADTQFVETTGVWIIKSVVIFAFVMGVVPMILLLERKLLGRFQNRYGPNRVGPYGLLQPLADVVKLLGKEPFYPATGVPRLMALAPGDHDRHRARVDRDHPVRRRRGRASGRSSASTGSTSTSASCTRSRSARSPSTG